MKNRAKVHRLLLLGKIACFIAILVAANYAGNWALSQLNFQLRPSTEQMFHRVIMTTTVIYIFLIALPFVPGVEIGLTLMVLFGAPIVFLVYLATVVGLTIGFLFGRLVPNHVVVELAIVLRLKRLQDLLEAMEPLGSSDRLTFLLQHVSSRLVPFLLRHRFLAIALAYNMPGNAVIGGGGGISFMAGFSRLFPFPQFLLTVSLAVAPLPMVIFFTGA